MKHREGVGFKGFFWEWGWGLLVLTWQVFGKDKIKGLLSIG